MIRRLRGNTLLAPFALEPWLSTRSGATVTSMDPSTPAELFRQAVSTMAEMPGAIQQRVNRAYLSSLSHVDVAAVIDELRPRVEALMNRLGATPMTRTMLTDDEGATVGTEIVSLAFDLAHRGMDIWPVGAGSRQLVDDYFH